jgi:hypothetical protein
MLPLKPGDFEAIYFVLVLVSFFLFFPAAIIYYLTTIFVFPKTKPIIGKIALSSLAGLYIFISTFIFLSQKTVSRSEAMDKFKIPLAFSYWFIFSVCVLLFNKTQGPQKNNSLISDRLPVPPNWQLIAGATMICLFLQLFLFGRFLSVFQLAENRFVVIHAIIANLLTLAAMISGLYYYRHLKKIGWIFLSALFWLRLADTVCMIAKMAAPGSFRPSILQSLSLYFLTFLIWIVIFILLIRRETLKAFNINFMLNLVTFFCAVAYFLLNMWIGWPY